MTQRHDPSQPAKPMSEKDMEKHPDNVSAGVNEPPADPAAAKAASAKVEGKEVVKAGESGREAQVVSAGQSGVAEAQRKQNAKDRRAHMEATVKRGETVYYHQPGAATGTPPREIRRVEDLPHEMELAETPEDNAAAKAQIDKEIERLQGIRDGVGKSHKK